MSTDEVLNQLDEALHDWDVSKDAMRCIPTQRTGDHDVLIEATWHPAFVLPTHLAYRDRPGALEEQPAADRYAASRQQVRALLVELRDGITGVLVHWIRGGGRR